MSGNLSDNNSNDNIENIIIDIIDIKDTKPSGKMQVLPNPNPDGRLSGKQKRKFFSTSKITAIIISIILIAFIAVVYLSDFIVYPDNYEPSENEINDMDSENYLSDSEICGRWTIVDYVENIDDFNADKLNYFQYGMKLYSYVYEFFEDGSAILDSSGKIEPCVWINKDKFNILPDNADIITVHAIEKIKNVNYIFIQSKKLDDITGAEVDGYYVFRRGREKELFLADDIRNKDLRNYNLSDSGNMMKTFIFDEKTIFPTDKNKMPPFEEHRPGYVIEHGRNPGLGIRDLHKQGITGKGVNIAIIAEPLITGHPEYKGRIAEYKDFGSGADSSIEGPAVMSLLAGENTGTAPGVKIYYAAVPAWNSYDAEYYAKALDWIVEINKTLPSDEKIKAVCISPNPENPLPWINVDKYLKSFQRAEKDGILVLDCSDEHGVVIGGCSYDFDNPEDVTLCRAKAVYRIMIASYHYDTVKDIFIDEEESNGNMLRAPVCYRTMATADNNGEISYSYQYDGKGQLSWAVPYVTGVLAMGWQVKPELTADEIIKILFDTAYVDVKDNKYIYPAKFIEYLKKN